MTGYQWQSVLIAGAICLALAVASWAWAWQRRAEHRWDPFHRHNARSHVEVIHHDAEDEDEQEET